jgi:16S rRNA (uracil1498-N3)-methyltransferase
MATGWRSSRGGRGRSDMSDHRRFFVDPEQIGAEEAVLEGSIARQISKVLRLKIGDAIALLDGLGNVYHAEIAAISAETVRARILSKETSVNEPSLRLVLASCVPKSDRTELIVQKCTELGISELVLVRSERTVVRLDESGQDKKLDRLRKIATEAAEQCGRSIVPRIRGVVSFSELVEMIGEFPLAVIAWEEEETSVSLREALRAKAGVESVLLVIGPEGGLTEREVELAKSAGAVSVSFGGRVLRTDTAAIAGCAALMYELEGQL